MMGTARLMEPSHTLTMTIEAVSMTQAVVLLERAPLFSLLIDKTFQIRARSLRIRSFYRQITQVKAQIRTRSSLLVSKARFHEVTLLDISQRAQYLRSGLLVVLEIRGETLLRMTTGVTWSLTIKMKLQHLSCMTIELLVSRLAH